MRWICLGYLLSLCACAPPQGLQLTRDRNFIPPYLEEPIYVAPLLTVMVPPAVAEGVFDRLVDLLNEQGEGREFVILKRERDAEAQRWLATQPHLTGELFGYLQSSGCCSTELHLKARLYYHQPGSAVPTLTTSYARTIFFEHDRTTIDAEQARMIEEAAATLAQALGSPLFGGPALP